MQVLLVLRSGKEVIFNSIASLKKYVSSNYVSLSSYTLDNIQVFRSISGKRAPFHHGIKTLYDFIYFYRV